MADKPTEIIRSVIADLPQNQLSTRQLKIAAGLSLVRDQGYTFTKAAAEADVPLSTLWRASRGLVPATDGKGVEINDAALVAASFDVAQVAAGIMTERMVDNPEAWANGDLVKAYGVATDKIAMKRGWKQGDLQRAADEGLSAIGKMLQGHTITATPIDRASRAIDVTASSTASEPD
jgi:hypothetical protein